MIKSANDWASPDPSKNIVLADADQFTLELAGYLGVQFGTRFVRTMYNEIISEAELRGNQFISPLPVNLCGYLAAAGSQEINISQFRNSLRYAAQADDPMGTLVSILQEAMPQTNVPNLFTRMPAVQNLIQAALQKF